MELLPDHLIETHLLPFLRVREAFWGFSLTCKRWRAISDRESHWKFRVEEFLFGELRFVRTRGKGSSVRLHETHARHGISFCDVAKYIFSSRGMHHSPSELVNMGYLHVNYSEDDHGRLTCVQYSGSLGGDRMVVADDIWALGTPYLKPVVSYHSSSKEMIVSLTSTHYFEIDIVGEDAVDAARYRRNRAPCISLGFTGNNLGRYFRQVGWDRNTFGFHSDDGNFYSGTGWGENASKSFGTGDTIGAGIIVARNGDGNLFFEIFLTINGAIEAKRRSYESNN